LVEMIQAIDKAGLEKLRSNLLEVAKRRYQWKIISEKYATCLE
jgi:hypothetical protein